MDEVDLAVLRAMLNGIPLTKEPFAEVAKKTGISQGEVITRLKKLMRNGVVKRFGLSINHREAGFVANALVAWKVPQNRVEEIGAVMLNYEAITHCYERETIPGKWEYNLFTVIHGRDRESVERLIEELSKSIGVDDYLTLFSVKKLKSSSAIPKGV